MTPYLSFSLAFLILSVAYGRPDEKYPTKYDNIDVDEILKSDRLLSNYVNCLMDRGSCSPDGTMLKNLLGDAIMTDCSKCSEMQKLKSKQVVSYLIQKKPDIWGELEAKFDPNGEYKLKYGAELEKLKSQPIENK